MKPNRIALLLAPLALAGCAASTQTASAPPPPAQAYQAGMVSAADPRAAEAGAQMLRQGGSATDAAIATMLALTVVEPQSSGIGGGGLFVSTNSRGQVETIDGRETAPSAASPKWFVKDGVQQGYMDAVPGGTSVGVPGNVALAAKAHRAHGRLPWAALYAPAIKLAREGFVMTPRFNNALRSSKHAGAFTAEGRALYYGADGEPLPVGTLIRNPALADTLQAIADQGEQAFYAGANRKAIVTRVTTAPRNPAPMTEADVAAYQAKNRPPVCAQYRQYRICGMGPPSSGATTVLATLGQLERFDMARLGKDSPVAWHLIAESQRLAYADRARYSADADFVEVPVAGMIDRKYLAQRSALIDPTRTMPSVAAGIPPGAERLARADAPYAEEYGTSHISVVDRAGNAVSYTSTIESGFGSGLVVGGYYLNNELTDFDMTAERDGRLVANRPDSGKRPRSSMSPTLVFGPDGKLKLVVGAAGGTTIPAQVIRVLIGVLDWDLSPQDALALPVIFAPGGNTVYLEKGTTLEAMAPALGQLGHADLQYRAAISFKAQAIAIDGRSVLGGADPRSEGKAVGE
ncbi:gamma-glutamyltransferase [Novosphingobium sp.]|uniref:gamma-glutamyltransferase n=1 Tax=Novosphingobium sp. TaxID=1874826 RepID=UPI0025FE876E|nr:gamma-glutamyltransferase [Novosphingobium sp.]MCC6927216.1 gamma-glutamyltransferase [Novosphingobium sp.]